jgi:hypothetical protein
MDDNCVEKVLVVIRQNVPHGETVNKEFYLNILKRLIAAVRSGVDKQHLDAAP